MEKRGGILAPTGFLWNQWWTRALSAKRLALVSLIPSPHVAAFTRTANKECCYVRLSPPTHPPIHSPGDAHTPDEQCSLTGEEHPEEAMVPLSDTVPQPGTMVVKLAHTSSTLVAVLGPHWLWMVAYATVATGNVGLWTQGVYWGRVGVSVCTEFYGSGVKRNTVIFRRLWAGVCMCVCVCHMQYVFSIKFMDISELYSVFTQLFSIDQHHLLKWKCLLTSVNQLEVRRKVNTW